MPSPEGARSEQFSVRLAWGAAMWVRKQAEMYHGGRMNSVIAEAVEFRRRYSDADVKMILALPEVAGDGGEG
jgi:hypothetical protein